LSYTNYIINVTCQTDGAYATARINVNLMSVSSFNIITYVNTSAPDCIFMFSVIYWY
jgi:hypothetical protein